MFPLIMKHGTMYRIMFVFIFRAVKPIYGMLDAYILQNAASVYYLQLPKPQQCHWSLDLFFTNIHIEVRLRAAFRRLSNYRQRVITESHRSTALEMLWKKGITDSVLRMRIIRLSELW